MRSVPSKQVFIPLPTPNSLSQGPTELRVGEIQLWEFSHPRVAPAAPMAKLALALTNSVWLCLLQHCHPSQLFPNTILLSSGLAWLFNDHYYSYSTMHADKFNHVVYMSKPDRLMEKLHILFPLLAQMQFLFSLSLTQLMFIKV